MTEVRPGGFQILPPVIKNLLIINVLVFAAKIVLYKANIINLDYYFALFHWNSPLFKIWQPITHIFMHGSFTHLLFNMFALWMFGSVIENTLGSKRFLIFYFICGLGAALCHLLVFNFENASNIAWFTQLPKDEQIQAIIQAIDTNKGDPRILPMIIPMVGASGAIFGLLFAFGYLFPNTLIYFYFLIPIRAKYFVALYALLELGLGIGNNPGDNVAHFAHLGGMLFAFILFRIWRIRSNKYA